jgi:hypothetical protein
VNEFIFTLEVDFHLITSLIMLKWSAWLPNAVCYSLDLSLIYKNLSLIIYPDLLVTASALRGAFSEILPGLIIADNLAYFTCSPLNSPYTIHFPFAF